MNGWRHFFRVYFSDGKSRDVTAQTKAGAMKTAAAVQRMVGIRGQGAKALRCEDVGHAGTGEEHCPRCRPGRSVS